MNKDFIIFRLEAIHGLRLLCLVFPLYFTFRCFAGGPQPAHLRKASVVLYPIPYNSLPTRTLTEVEDHGETTHQGFISLEP